MKNITINIAPGSIINVILFVLLIGLLFFLRDIVLIVLTAVVLASSIEPGVLFFMRHGLNRVVSVLLLYGVLILGILIALFVFAPPLLEDAANFLSNLPATLESINVNQGVTDSLFPGEGVVKLSPAQFADQIRTTFSTFTGGVFSTLSSFFGGIISFVLIIVFSIYFAVQETGIDDFLRVVTPVKHEKYVLSLWKRSQDKIGKWMQGQLLLGLIVGILIYLGLTILGIPHALLLAVLAALFELIPVFGQILAAIPAVAIAFSTGGVSGALFIVGLYTIVQQFEAHLIYPLVVKKVVGVPPLLVILALLIGAKLAGFLGILLSVPIAAALQEFVSDIQKTKERELARMREEA